MTTDPAGGALSRQATIELDPKVPAATDECCGVDGIVTTFTAK